MYYINFLRSRISKDFDFKACRHFDAEALSQIPISDQYPRETTSKEVVHRLVGCWKTEVGRTTVSSSMVTKTF